MLDINNLYLNVRHCRYREDPGGQEWGPRTIPDYELVLIIKGSYLYIDEEGRIELQPGDLLLIEPEIEHTFRKIPEADPGTHACAHFDLVDQQGTVYLISQLGLKPRRVVTVNDIEYIRQTFRQAASDFVSYTKFHQELVNTAIRQIWLRVAEKWFAASTHPVSGTISHMMEYLRTNLTRPVTRTDLAKHFHYTPEYINYLFKKELGISPSRFLDRKSVV